MKIYHIYAKDNCLLHCIKEEDFEITWNTIKNMVGIMKTDYKLEDLSFIELEMDPLDSLYPSY